MPQCSESPRNWPRSNGVHIEVMDPNVILNLVDHKDVAVIAAEVRQKLEQALAQV